MKTYLVYRFANAEQRIKAENFLRDIGAVVRPQIIEVDTDTPEGSQRAQLYQIYDYPAILITRDDGQLVQLYQQKWPLLSEIRHQMNPQL